MYDKTSLRLKKFFRSAVSADNQREFNIHILGINLKRGKVTAITFIILEIASILDSIMVQQKTFFNTPPVYYLFMYAIMIIVMIFFLLAFIKLEKNIEQHILAIWIAGITFAGFILLWCAGITLLDQLTSGQIIVYTVAILFVAVVPHYSPRMLFSIYLVVEIIFILLLPKFQTSDKFLFDDYLNSASYVVLAWAVSNVIFKNRIEEFNNNKIIQEKNAELQRINKELTEANQALEKLSVTDGLANIYNRTYFDQTIKAEWDRCKRYQFPISLIMADIDFFKEFNDNYGHQAGDNCIRQVAYALFNCVNRSSDVVARYGGDEFAILLPHMEKENVSIIAYKMKKRIKDLAIPHKYSLNSSIVSVSIGTYTIIPSDGYSISEFIDYSDKALYEAKKTRDNIVVT
jgi:diguanylate cyclase (GGDEF)-like protein